MGRTSIDAHWDAVYRARAVTDLSWYQPRPTVSLELIELLGVTPETPVVDVGAGESTLVDELLLRGFTDVSALDVSAAALDHVRARLGASTPGLQLLHRDLLEWEPEPRYGLWHDRAVLHFLVEEGDRRRYLEVLRQALAPGGAVVVGAFAPNGPERCSGLPVLGHSPADLVRYLGPGFELIARRHEDHETPDGAHQAFTWVALRADHAS